MRILVAEDDPASRKVLTLILQRSGHEIVAVTDGTEAWTAMQCPDAPQIAIIDWMMPGIDGIELCQRIRAHAGETYVYIVLQTAKDRQEDIDAGFAAGVDDYLVKPLDKRQLLQRVRVAERVIRYEERLSQSKKDLVRYASQMESLAKERATQLVHSDRMATLGLLAAGIAHEINNPATFISGNAQTMTRAWDVVAKQLANAQPEAGADSQLAFILEEFPAMLAGVRRGVDRISKIVSGLKSYARVDCSQKTAFDIHAAIEAAHQLCHNSLKYHIEVEVSVPELLPAVIGTEQQIEQVLVNLITNAADAMEAQERGRLRIEAEERDGMMRVSVQDNGPGIPQEIIDKLFNPFFTTKDPGKGTGLGLSISKGIIEEHQGELTVENTRPRGVRFTFTLPIHHADEEAMLVAPLSQTRG